MPESICPIKNEGDETRRTCFWSDVFVVFVHLVCFLHSLCFHEDNNKTQDMGNTFMFGGVFWISILGW